MIYTLAIIFSIIFVLFIIMLVRNNKLEEKYSILWMIFGILIIVLSLNYKILDKIAVYLGIFYAPAMFFLVGFIFVVFLIIHLSTVVTKLNKTIIKLDQEVAILKEKLGKNNKVY